MNNLFTYTKTEGQGWLVEKPEMEKPVMGTMYYNYQIEKYEAHLTTLRRFKYDYPDPGKEMELRKDFEVKRRMLSYKETISDDILTSSKTEIIDVAIPITQRIYSEQDLLDTWNGGYDRAWDVSKGDLTDGGSKNQQEFFKTRFGIEIK